jgi:oligopeptide transport system substrate-binding protein
LTVLYNYTEGHARIAEAIQQMWMDNLGVEVQLSSQEFATYRSGWCHDYFDAHSFLFEVFYSNNNPDNHFANAEFDALIEQAYVATTVEECSNLYAEAENILVNTNASIAPIYYHTSDQLTANNINCTVSVINREYYEKWGIEG